MKKLPHLLVSDKDGNIFPHPSLKMAGRSAIDMVEVPKEELIPLPEGSEIFTLPGRTPFGWDEKTQELVSVDKGPLGQEAWACAAFMAPAHTQFLLPAYRAKPNAPRLPLFAYTAVGELYGKLFVPAGRIDPDSRQDLKNFSQEEIARRVKARLKAEPKNRLVAYLSTCALVNACPGAKNFFLGRWEAPLPTSPACNSDCVGCPELPDCQHGLPFHPEPHPVYAYS